MRTRSLTMVALLAAVLLGCGDDGFSTSPEECLIPVEELTDGGVGKDVIPALTDPQFLGAGEIEYMSPQNRVIGIQTAAGPVAIPHNILWWHEIVNMSVDGVPMAITLCPLTGSSMAFDRRSAGGAEFGVSGLLFQNNLVMYDRNSRESLWPQMMRQAGCGDRNGQQLTMAPIQEMSWEGWLDLYPDSRVVSSQTGHARNYTSSGYPYGNYEEPSNRRLLFAQAVDERRQPKERVLGIPSGMGGVGLPFGELDEEETSVVRVEVDGRALVVFWSRAHESAMAFEPVLGAQSLTFSAEAAGFRDNETGTLWSIVGEAVEGPLAGQQLTLHAEAYVAFWFAWAAFQPEALLWERG